MIQKTSQPWLAFERIDEFLQIEPALLILGLAFAATIASKIFFQKLPFDRRKTLTHLVRNLIAHLLLGSSLFAAYSLILRLPTPSHLTERVLTYLGLSTILSGAVIFVKVSRIFVFQYLFLSHKKVAFPVLLVNLFTLLLSMILAIWLGAEIFNVRLGPILATSAIFSLVLGLALQDTLGNLFAGVTLQFDKPYEIGDWIEVQNGNQKWLGQVDEISWRATLLIAASDETITIPNRVMAQAQISNFSTQLRPILRSILFRLPLHVDLQKAKLILLRVPSTIEQVRSIPAPKVLITETQESWIGFKLIVSIDDFGKQVVILDQLYTAGIEALRRNGISLASHHLVIHTQTKDQNSNLS